MYILVGGILASDTSTHVLQHHPEHLPDLRRNRIPLNMEGFIERFFAHGQFTHGQRTHACDAWFIDVT